MLIQIHMLQSYAPANLNRDETGSPKDTIFGGIRRGRISSQCLKRSMRLSNTFVDTFKDDGLLADRTKRLPQLVRDALIEMNVEETVRDAIVNRVPEIGQESTKRDAKKSEADVLETRQLIFIGANEVQRIAEKLLSLYEENGAKKWEKLPIDKITKTLGSSLPQSVDIAMFGRMTTSAAFEDVQAAVQVAHALSVNALNQEFDYFTAVDDISGQSGAGMIGDVEYNSSTYYKYMSIHWEQLVKNLSDDTEIAKQAVQALLMASATAQPSGKQNSFAAHNLPDFVLIEISDKNLPVSYANAFLKPATQSYDMSLMETSLKMFDNYTRRIRQMYGLENQRAYATSVENTENIDGEKQTSLDALRDWMTRQLP